MSRRYFQMVADGRVARLSFRRLVMSQRRALSLIHPQSKVLFSKIVLRFHLQHFNYSIFSPLVKRRFFSFKGRMFLTTTMKGLDGISVYMTCNFCPSSGIRNLPRKVLKTYNPNCINVGLGELARRYWADRRSLSMYFDCLLFGHGGCAPLTAMLTTRALSNNNGNVNSSKSCPSSICTMANGIKNHCDCFYTKGHLLAPLCRVELHFNA